MALLSEAVREIGKQQAGGIVLMHGLGYETLPEVAWKNTAFDAALADIEGKTGLLAEATPYYTFLYPAGYEALLGTDMTPQAHPSLWNASASIALADGAVLASALAFLSHTTGVTFVADNAIAEARAGELWLPEAPATVLLDALLKSARVPVSGVKVESGDGYLFLHTDRPQPETLLNGTLLTPVQQNWLNEAVTVYLPEAPSGGRLPLAFEPKPLAEMAPVLARQLGAQVTFERGLEDLPVNQCALLNLPRSRVLDLLIRQWLVPRFGYEVTDLGIHIKTR
ncbi:MAG: hypothetical protein GC168_17980 [Candidatus Hydrogenedens sp.]|nr:hypothetical protein [Candidatus Hydrogenedens sp.]